MTTTRRAAAALTALSLMIAPCLGHHKPTRPPAGKIMGHSGKIYKQDKKGCFFISIGDLYPGTKEGRDYDKGDGEFYCPR